jgi:hypothetical protein
MQVTEKPVGQAARQFYKVLQEVQGKVELGLSRLGITHVLQLRADQ